MMKEEFEIVNSVNGLSKLKNAVERIALLWDLTEKVTLEVNLILEELCANYYEHSGDDASNSIRIRLSLEGNRMTMKVTDSGPPFNPDTIAAPNLDESLKDRKSGGLGLYFVRHFTEEVSYVRENDLNILTITKSI